MLKTERMRVLKIPLSILPILPANIFGEILKQLHPETKLLGAHDGIANAQLTWYFTNPNYPEVPAGNMYPEIIVDIDLAGPNVRSVDEGLSHTTLPTATGILGHLPIYPMGGPIVYNGATPTPKPFSQHTKDVMDQLHKQITKKLNQDAMDALVYGGPLGVYYTPQCECGVDAAKSGGNHSSWCPKYEA